MRHLVELRAEDVVDLLALREHVVQRNVADDGSQRGRREGLRGAGEVDDGGHGLDGVEDLRVDQEVDADRCVVLRDAGLLRHLEESLAQVDLHGLLHEREEQDQARAAAALEPSQEEDDQPLVLTDDVDDAGQENQQNRQANQEDDQADQIVRHPEASLLERRTVQSRPA